jgi:hypothetical protein
VVTSFTLVNRNPANFEYERYVMTNGAQQAYRSTDGISYSSLWTGAENTILTLPANLYVGYSVSEGYNGAAATAELDWLMVRQYAATEPTTSAGTEQQEPGGSAVITFSLSGPGTLLGTTNPAAVDGAATVVLRSTLATGTATVTATNSGLAQGAAQVEMTSDAVPAKVLATATPASISADGAATSLITARICTDADALVASATNTVVFGVSGQGTLIAPTSKAASGGIATILMRSTATPGNATVNATSTGLTQDSVVVTTVSDAVKILAAANPTSIAADGLATSLITATVCDSGDAPVNSATNTIVFGVSGQGTLIAPTSKAASGGIATILMRSTSTTGTATVTATSTGLAQGSAAVITTQQPVSILAAANPVNIAADGTSTSLITATIRDGLGALVNSATNTIAFGVSGPGTLIAPTSKAASGGAATIYMRSTTSYGTATVTATSSGLGQDSAMVVTAQHPVKVICSSDRASISANGTATATITAAISDALDDTVLSATNAITFSVTANGNLVAPTVKSAVSGMATVLMTSSQTGGATVTATATGLAQGNVFVDTVLDTADNPANLSTGSISEHSMKVSWNPGADNVRYRVRMRKDGDAYADALTNYTSTSWTVTGLKAGTQYYFMVYGIDGDSNESTGVETSGTTTAVEEIQSGTGGTVGTLVQVVVPADTFAEDGYIDINDSEDTGDAGGLVSVEGSVRDIEARTLYGITISTFARSVELKIYYTDNDIAGIIEDSLRIYRLDEGSGGWVKIGGTVDKQNRCVKVDLEHFSVYCIMGESSEDALEITNVANYPNPVTAETIFTFEINRSASVRLDIYTASGRLVKSYPGSAVMEAGYCELPESGPWDGTGEGSGQLANGVYIYRLTAVSENGGTATATGKLVIMK